MNQTVSSATAKEKLYFIAIIPPAPIYDEALEQKQYFKDHYKSKASLEFASSHYAAHAISME